ncbi:unnamed protein product [Rotaria magnacalcarata]|uniref:Uncharacterized protein n=1 Tax=Rotaria magnacalcarata TaxID=392030 RepID=A0A8S3H1G1_9BILA|nr:unnamed protein product [Rotaria magnacalcarata]
MMHFFRGRRFETFDQVEAACREFFEFKEPHWYRDQIRQLAERWRKVNIIRQLSSLSAYAQDLFHELITDRLILFDFMHMMVLK